MEHRSIQRFGTASSGTACALRILFSHVQLIKNMQIESTKHRKLLLVPVSFFAHEKGGIYNRSEFIMSTDKPNLGVLNQRMRLEYEPMECLIRHLMVHLLYINSIVNTSLMQCVH